MRLSVGCCCDDGGLFEATAEDEAGVDGTADVLFCEDGW